MHNICLSQRKQSRKNTTRNVVFIVTHYNMLIVMANHVYQNYEVNNARFKHLFAFQIT